MGLFEVTRITRTEKTGKRLGVVRAKNDIEAANILSSQKKLPKNIRVFPVRLVKSENPRSRVRVFF